MLYTALKFKDIGSGIFFVSDLLSCKLKIKLEKQEKFYIN